LSSCNHSGPSGGWSTSLVNCVPLLGLAKANAELVLDLQCRRPVKTATLDVDDTVIHYQAL
jgi:hypothetical protein